MADDNKVTEGGEVTTTEGTVNPLSANIGIDFSLIGTRLHAAYEKSGKDGYAVLLIPSEQEADNGVSIGEVISDIKKLVKGVDEKANTETMEADLESGVSGLENGGSSLDKLIIKLQMAYLYIRKSEKESALEYAFQLQVISKDVIPKAIQQLVTIDNVSISVWNTQRQKVIDKMALVTINDYLGTAAQAQLPG